MFRLRFFLPVAMGLFLWPAVLFSQQGHENPNIRKGWSQFAENNLVQARTSFSKELDGPDSDLAHLGISLVETAFGDPRDAMFHYVQYFERCENPTPLIKAMWSIYGGEKDELEMDFLEQILESEDGTLRTKAAQALGAHYLIRKNRDKAQEYFDMAGGIKEWRLVGEFENISESGFDNDFGVLQHPEAEAPFVNKRGVDITWFDLLQPRIDNWVDFEYHFYSENSLYYAQTFCKSPIEQEVQFRLGVSGSAKVWVNDKLMFSEQQERDNGLDSYIFTGLLREGINRILIQVGTSETDEANFLLRLTDETGTPLEGIDFQKGAAPYPQETVYKSKRLPDEVELFFLNEIEQHPDYLEHYLTLGQYYLISDQVFKARKILLAGKERFPDCGYLMFHLVNANAKADNVTEASQLIEEIKVKDPNGYLSLDLLYDEAINKEEFEEAERILETLEDRVGVTADLIEKKVSLARSQGRDEAIIELVDVGYRIHPTNPTFVLLKSIIEVQVEKDLVGGKKVLKKYLKYRENAMITRTLIDLYFKGGDVNHALATYRDLVDKNPLATGYLGQLASICFSLGRVEEAEKYLKQCIKVAPYVGSYYKSMAENYRDMENEEMAILNFKKALNLNPYDYESREQIRLLTGVGGVFDNFDEPNIEELFRNSPGAEAFPEHHSIILLDEKQKIVYPGGGAEERRYLAAKVLNNRGVDYWKEYNIYLPGNQEGFILEAEILKQNGSKIPAQNDGGYIVFSNLEPGDAVFISYQVRDYYTGELIGHFWDQHFFQHFLPIEMSRFSLIVPEDKKFQYLVENGEVTEELTDVTIGEDRFDKYVWTNQNVPALEDEAYMPSMVDVGTTLHLSSFPNWEYVADWYSNLARAKSKPTFEVDQVIQELFDEEETYTERETILKIYDYIVDNIRYASVPFLQSGLVPQKASRVVAAKQGDCKDVSTLFVAMCAARGIDANLVLINTRNHGRKDLILPSISFNHCIASVELEGKNYFVELTSENLPFSAGELSVKNAFALPITDDNSGVEGTVINAETRILNEVVRSTEVTFEGNKMIVRNQSEKSGTAALNMRNVYEGIGPDAQFDNMQEAVNGDFPNIQLRSVNFGPDLNDNSRSVSYQYDYEVPEVFMNIGSLEIFKIPLADPIVTPDFVASSEREHDVEIWAYIPYEAYDQEIIFHIPETKQLSEVPKDVFFDTPYFHYEMTFVLDGDKLAVRRIFFLKEERVPQESFQELKDILNQIVKTDDLRLAFEE